MKSLRLYIQTLVVMTMGCVVLKATRDLCMHHPNISQDFLPQPHFAWLSTFI